jgi:hypothetical protein
MRSGEVTNVKPPFHTESPFSLPLEILERLKFSPLFITLKLLSAEANEEGRL